MITDRERAILELLFKNGIACNCCDSADCYCETVKSIVALFDREEWRVVEIPPPVVTTSDAVNAAMSALRNVYLFGPPIREALSTKPAHIGWAYCGHCGAQKTSNRCGECGE